MQLATAPVVGEPSKPGQTALSGVERQAGGWVWMAIRLRTNPFLLTKTEKATPIERKKPRLWSAGQAIGSAGGGCGERQTGRLS